MPFQQVEVKTYSGYRGSERPVGFWFDGQYREVEEIVDRWYEGGLVSGRPILHYFRVRTRTGSEYLLRHTPPSDRWEIHIAIPTNGNP